MKIYPLVSLKSDWYPKQSFETFSKYSEIIFVDNPYDADIIWIYSYYSSLSALLRRDSWFFYKLLNVTPFIKTINGSFPLSPKFLKRHKYLENKIIVSTIHHLDQSKKNEWFKYVKELDRISDFIQFFSEPNIKENQMYFSSPIIKMPYWIDNTHFNPLSQEKIKKIKQDLELPFGKKILGSFQRDTESDCKSPKLAKGPDIFCDVVEKLDRKEWFILLSGPRRQYVESRLERIGIPFKSLGHCSIDKMNDIYNAIDRYLVTSRVEGGPQAILECMATKTPIFSTPVGIYDSLSPDVIKSTAEDFVDALNNKYPDVIESHYEKSKDFFCDKVVKKWEFLFDELKNFEAGNNSKFDFYNI